LFFVTATIVWLRLDRLPPTWDDAWYLTNSLTMFDALVDGGVSGYFGSFWTILGFKGPLITVLPTPAYLVFGRHAWAAFAVNVAAMLVLFAAIYRLGEKYGGSRAGVIALYVCGAMPMLYGLSRWFLVEYVLTATVAVAVLLLIEGRALAFGVVCGFGILLKVNFPIYVAGIFFYWAVTHRALLGRARTWLALSPAVLIPAPWYGMHLRKVWQVALEAGGPTAEFYGNAGPVKYFVRLVREGPSFYFGVLLAVLLVWGIIDQRRVTDHERRWSVPLFLLLAWMAPFVFFVFGPFQETRYTAPLLPAMALGIALLLCSRGRVVTAALLAFPLVAMAQNSFGVFGTWRVNDARYIRRYDKSRWPRAEIVRRLRSGKVLLGSDTPHFNADTLALAAKETRAPLDISTTAYEENAARVSEQLSGIAYFIYKDGGAERQAWVLNKLGAGAVEEVQHSSDFAEIWQMTMPDGGVARVFQNYWRNSFARGGGLAGRADDRFNDCGSVFGEQIALTGISARALDGTLEVKYRWRCIRPPDHEYWCFTHVLDDRDQVVGYLDHPILDGNPSMLSWLPGDEAIERRRLRSGAIQVRRRYALRVGVFDKASGQNLRVTGAPTCPASTEGTAVLVQVR